MPLLAHPIAHLIHTNPFLQGNLAPVRVETTAFDLPVRHDSRGARRSIAAHWLEPDRSAEGGALPLVYWDWHGAWVASVWRKGGMVS
jgi:hypothetical protein